MRKQLTLSLALFALLGCAAAQASADTILKGNFSLPEPAYLGSTLLQPGEYSFSVSKEASGINIVHVNGEVVLAIFTSGTLLGDTAVRSELELTDVNGTYVIRELRAGSIGKSFGFGVSKAARQESLHASGPKDLTVPVSGF
jgi:hypothetical protein